LGEVSHKDPWLVRKLLNLYIPALEWSLSHTRQVFAVAIIMMLVTAALYTRVGKTFMPSMTVLRFIEDAG